ncbi:hypothetical protein ABFA25_05490 [Mycobacterium lepromatosis]
MGNRGQTNYATTKAGIRWISKILQRDVKRVNCRSYQALSKVNLHSASSPLTNIAWSSRIVVLFADQSAQAGSPQSAVDQVQVWQCCSAVPPTSHANPGFCNATLTSLKAVIDRPQQTRLGKPPPVDQLVVGHGYACSPGTQIDNDCCGGHVDFGSFGVSDLVVAKLSVGLKLPRSGVVRRVFRCLRHQARPAASRSGGRTR